MKHLRTLTREEKFFFIVSLSIDEDAELINKLRDWATTSDECKGWYNLWLRFKNFESDRAFTYVLLDEDGEIVGMNAFTCNSRNPYVNCYYYEVDKKFRGQGFGSDIFWACFEKGLEMGNTRLTLRTKGKSIGFGFYKHIGMVPRYFDPKTKEYIFDMPIKGLQTLKDIKVNKLDPNDQPHSGRQKMYDKYEKL